MAHSNDRSGMEKALISRALKDDAYRQRLSSDPKGVLRDEFGMNLPDDLDMEVVQETPNKVYLVLPAAPSAGAPLSREEFASASDSCDGWSSFVGCTFECTQCGNNDTSCAPGPTGEE